MFLDQGASIAVLDSVQVGLGIRMGKTCDIREGYYRDEETKITSPGVLTWIKHANRCHKSCPEMGKRFICKHVLKIP